MKFVNKNLNYSDNANRCLIISLSQRIIRQNLFQQQQVHPIIRPADNFTADIIKIDYRHLYSLNLQAVPNSDRDFRCIFRR